jgi:hypothetical protein
MDYNEQQLNKHLAKLEEEYARDEAIDDLAVEIAEILGAGNHYQANSGILDMNRTYWCMDDFTSDVEISSVYMAELIGGRPQSHMEDMQEKFSKFCHEAASESIDIKAKLDYEYAQDAKGDI